MNADDFEKELKGHSFRKVPEHWRAQILRNASAAAETERSSSDRSGGLSRLRELFWPNPAAWGTLAAVWIMIVCFRFATSDASASKNMAPDTYAKLRSAIEQKRELYAELNESTAQIPAEPPKPRSQRRSEIRCA